MNIGVEKKITEILTTILKVKIDRDSNRDNTNQWDSLKHIEIIFALEDAFGVSFTEQQIEKMTSVKTLAQELKDYET